MLGAPTAETKLDAAHLAGERPAGAGHRRPAARRDVVSDPDGVAVRAGRRRDAVPRPHHPGRRLPRPHGPSDAVERWEEQSGYSPSTIAAEIAGLTAAAHIAGLHGDTARSRLYQATADDFARNIKSWTVTTTGPYISSSVPSYFIRLSKTGDPNAAISYNLGNGSGTYDQRAIIDQSGTSLGSAQLIVDQPSGTATLVMPRSAFGSVGSGWVFTVALTGQGSGNPWVRNFTQPAGQYSFGVCPSGDTAAICSVNPNSVPTVMDTITPPGVSQAAELDPTRGPVVLQGVSVP
jgi:hypothetical protein